MSSTPFQVQDSPASVAALRFLCDALDVPAQVAGGRLAVDGKPAPVVAVGRADGPINLNVRPRQFELATSDQAHVSGIVRNLYRSQGRAHLSIDRPDAGSFETSLADGPMPGPDEPIGLRITGGYTF